MTWMAIKFVVDGKEKYIRFQITLIFGIKIAHNTCGHLIELFNSAFNLFSPPGCNIPFALGMAWVSSVLCLLDSSLLPFVLLTEPQWTNKVPDSSWLFLWNFQLYGERVHWVWLWKLYDLSLSRLWRPDLLPRAESQSAVRRIGETSILSADC